jgi:hypothetical protein
MIDAASRTSRSAQRGLSHQPPNGVRLLAGGSLAYHARVTRHRETAT